MEKTAVGILNSINVDLDNSDVEACHKNDKSKDVKTMVNYKFYKKALPNKKKLSSVAIKDNEIQFKNKVFTNENLTDYNNKVVFQCRKL